MTGRELIIFILVHHLEDEVLFEDGKMPGYLTVEEAAIKIGTGVETVKALYKRGALKGFKLGDTIFIKED